MKQKVRITLHGDSFDAQVDLPAAVLPVDYGQGLSFDYETGTMEWLSMNDLCDAVRDGELPVNRVSLSSNNRVAVNLVTDSTDRYNGWEVKDRSMTYSNLLELKWHAEQLNEAVNLAEHLHECRDRINLHLYTPVHSGQRKRDWVKGKDPGT